MQRDETNEPVVVWLTELGYLHPVVCARNGCAHRHGQDGLEFMPALARKARVGDELQVLQQGRRSVGGGDQTPQLRFDLRNGLDAIALSALRRR